MKRSVDKTYFLENCKEMHLKNPSGFEIPPDKDIEELRVGDFARLIFKNERDEGERMWVEITHINKDKGGWFFEGKLTNHPIVMTNLVEGDIIRFGKRHFADLLYKEAAERLDKEFKKTGRIPEDF